MRRLILHIGPHKTGTSSFQHWLRDRAAALSDAGLVVPLPFLNANANGAPLARALMAAPGARSAEQTDVVKRFTGFCAAHPGASIILSAEAFSRILLRENLNDSAAQSDEPDSGLLAHRLHAALAPLGFDRIDILLLLRDQVGCLTSGYMQRLKTMNLRWDLTSEAAQHIFVRPYADSFHHLSRIGFHIVAAPYRDQANDSPLARRLMDMAGFGTALEGQVAFGTPQGNVSPGYLTMIGLGHLFWNVETAASCLAPPAQTRLRRAVLEATRGVNVAGDSPMTLFTPGRALQIAARQRPHLAGLERWTGGLTAADICDTFPPYPAQSPLSHTALDLDRRSRVDRWLHGIADTLADDPFASTLLDDGMLRDLEASPAGIHAAPPGAARCIGGIGAAAVPDGRRPASSAPAPDRHSTPEYNLTPE